MKKLSFLILSLLILSTSAFAQRNGGNNNDGSVVLRDGRRVILIQVGDDRDERDMMKRVIRLEKAVMDLQNQVYQLQTNIPSREITVCSGNFFSVGTIVAKAPTQTEARAKVISQCQAKDGGIFCKEKDVTCETSLEN